MEQKEWEYCGTEGVGITWDKTNDHHLGQKKLGLYGTKVMGIILDRKNWNNVEGRRHVKHMGQKNLESYWTE